MKLIITVNPHGGKKKGLELLNKIKPIFDSNNVELSIIETTFAGHAKELAYNIKISEYDGFIGIGGDGTLHEIINGMLLRQRPINKRPKDKDKETKTKRQRQRDKDKRDKDKLAESRPLFQPPCSFGQILNLFSAPGPQFKDPVIETIPKTKGKS